MLLHDLSAEAVESREGRHVLGTYSRSPIHITGGRGARVFDASGREYWDLLSGIAVNALGHGHPALIEALREAADAPLHLSNLYYHPYQGLLAQRLTAVSGLQRAFFCNSGTEANEAAIKFAKLARPGRSRIVALEESFHGRTLGALALTGHEAYRTPFAPFGVEVAFVKPNDIGAIEEAIDGTTLAVFLEPIMGEAGVIPLSAEFMHAAARAAARAGALVVCDEVQTGVGRTGEWFAFQHSLIEPDIVTLAKPIGGGLPLGAVLVTSEVAAAVKPGHHGTTFGGNPVACRLGIAVLETIEREGLLFTVRDRAQLLSDQLAALADRHEVIVEIRGEGLMWGIEIDGDASPIANRLQEAGFLVGVSRNRVIRLLPPLVIPRDALTQFVGALDSILAAAYPQQDATKLTA